MNTNLKSSITNVSIVVFIVLLFKSVIRIPTYFLYNFVRIIGELSHFSFITDFFAICLTFLSYSIVMGLSILLATLIFQMPKKIIFPFNKPYKEFTLLSVTHTVSIGFILNLAVMVIMLLFGLIGVNFKLDEPIFYHNIPSILLNALFIGIFPAIFEEMLFRGIILQSLRPYSNNIAVFVSALAFALCHNNFPQAIFAFCMGIIFAILTIRSGSLIPSIIAHFIYNFSGEILSNISNHFITLGAVLFLNIFMYLSMSLFAVFSYKLFKNKYGSIYWYPNLKEQPITNLQIKEMFTSIPFIMIIVVCVFLFMQGVIIGVL